MVQLLSLGILTLILVIIFIDIIPRLKDWLFRIHIGRYSNVHKWNKSIVNMGIKWLNKTPKIKVTDNTRLVFIDMIKGNYTKSSIQYWQEASLLLGLSEYLKRGECENSKDEINKFLINKFGRDGQWREKPKHIDGAILAYAVMKLDFVDSTIYRKALDDIWELIKDHIGEDETVGYRKSMQGYRYVDTIGFICPFLVTYGIKFNKIECIELAINQIKEYEKYGLLGEQGIPCHAYDVENKLPLGLYGWGRGLGWYAIGLIDAWNELPPGHQFKSCLEESVIRFAKAAREFQQSNGSWNWTITRKEASPDSSTTATLGWFMINAAKIDSISVECVESANKAISYLMKVTRKNGAVDFSQGDTKDIGVYSNLFNILPFTQGFCIRVINYHSRVV